MKRTADDAEQRIGFTLIELLVVVSITALLISILLPSLSKARENSAVAVCASNQRQLAAAATAYISANWDWMNPIEDWWPSSAAADRIEVTFRVLLFPYTGRVRQVFDCPTERLYVYSDGFSEADERRTVALGGPSTGDRERWPFVYGIMHPLERWNFGGIGVSGVHWFRKNAPDLRTRPRSIPFGRPIESGYPEGLAKYSQVRVPARLIWFGDGAGDESQVKWGDDLGWWIRYPASDYSQGNPGFNRLLMNNYGCRRHNGKANYAFADGHAGKMDANDIPCTMNECWWSIRPDVHRAAAAPAGL